MSEQNSHIIDDLLVKHLLGETNEVEQVQVSAWISESDANRKHYEQLKKIWDSSRDIAAKSTIAENAAWQRFQQRIEQTPPKPKTIPLSSRGMSWMKIAAILILLVGGAWLTNALFFNSYHYAYVHTEGNTTSETLPDGTVVTLNKESRVKYSDVFTGNIRKVTLEGEAFFDVAPDKSKPFIITVNNVEVKVVGTSFNVKGTNNKTEVIVETGIVEVTKKENMVKLKPKEKAIVLPNSPAPIKETNDDALYNYYRTKEFVCDNTPLWRLVDVLNDAYNVNIIIANDNIRDLQINTTFKNETLDNILQVISETLNIKIERTGNQIIFK